MAGIIVGVDGSAGAHRALDWAMKEAAAHHAHLTVVAVHEVPVSGWTGNPIILGADAPELGPHVIGQSWPVSFIGGKLLVAKGGCGPVKGHGDIGRFFLCKSFHEHGGEAKGRVDRLSAAVRQLFGDSVKGAVNQRVPVDQD